MSLDLVEYLANPLSSSMTPPSIVGANLLIFKGYFG
jgi:hypothetical protein